MKRASAKISLVLIGAAMLHGCNRTVETRDLYLTRSDCVQDWGDQKKCAPGRDDTSGRSVYYGPYYSGARNAPGSRSESRAITSRSVVRGGFGASASAHGGSSS